MRSRVRILLEANNFPNGKLDSHRVAHGSVLLTMHDGKRPTHPRPKTVLNHFTKKWHWFELFFSVDKSSDISKNFSGTRTRESLRLKIRIVASIKNLYHSGDSIGSLLRMLLKSCSFSSVQ